MTLHTIEGARIQIRDNDSMPWRDVVHHQPPLPSQGGDLRGLRRMLLGNVCEDADFSFHQPNVRMWDYPAVHHCPVSVQCLAGEDDALVGFFGGHGGAQ